MRGARIALLALSLAAGPSTAAPPLDPLALEKFVDPMPLLGTMRPVQPGVYEIGMWPIRQRLHSQLPPTPMWGYGPSRATASYPGRTIEAARGVPIEVRWTSHLPAVHLFPEAVDRTLHMAHPSRGVPVVVHLHGGEVEPQSDGHPEAWFTADFAEKGPAWRKATYHYANRQPPATLWYHDHALGLTRMNIYAGLAGFYLLRDPGREPAGLPAGKYEIPIMIQDRSLLRDGSLVYPHHGDNPQHPAWVPEVFGDLIVVNGRIWPYLEVEPRRYRLRLLNASNARFYRLALRRRSGAPGPRLVQIGSDGGYLASPVTLDDPSNPRAPRLLVAPGERADLVADFAALPVGAELVLENTAPAPFPGGRRPDPRTVGQIMLFRIVPPEGVDSSSVPQTLRRVTRIEHASRTRTLTIEEAQGPRGPLAGLLDGSMWTDPITERPVLGSTEEWEIANLTEDTHPIHLHLLQFQVVNRQRLDAADYLAALDRERGGPLGGHDPASGRLAESAGHPRGAKSRPPRPPLGPFLVGEPIAPDANESGWKDTVRMNPGQVTRIIVRFAPQEGGEFPFDAAASPGYMWHCHILEHGDNEMMRPIELAPAPR